MWKSIASYIYRIVLLIMLSFTIMQAFSLHIFFCLIATTDQQAASFEMEMSQAGFSAHYSQVNKLSEKRS